MADKNSAFGGSPAQYSYIVKAIELSLLRSLEVDARFLAKRRCDNELVKIVVSLKANAHALTNDWLCVRERVGAE